MNDRRGAEGAEDAEDAERKGGLEEPEEGLSRLTEAVIGAALEVHRELGPRFVESFYEEVLCMELAERAVPFVRQAVFPVRYKGVVIGETRLDLPVDRRVVVELKASMAYGSLHLAQVLSYLSATGLTLGLLINFNVPSLRQGIRRVVRSSRRSPASASSAPLRSSPKIA